MKLIHWKKEKETERNAEKNRDTKRAREKRMSERVPQPHWAVSLVKAGCEGSHDCGERLEAEALMVWVLYRCSDCSV